MKLVQQKGHSFKKLSHSLYKEKTFTLIVKVFYTGGRGRTDTPEEHDFESCASANSATPAWRRQPDSNRWIKVLQTLALPLGYAAEYLGAEDGIRTRDPNLGKVVFYH